MRPRHRCRGRPLSWEVALCQLSTCFNEAAASLPRKTLAGVESRFQVRLASMRPRHRCRGRHPSVLAPVARPSSFNEAAASLPRKTSR